MPSSPIDILHCSSSLKIALRRSDNQGAALCSYCPALYSI
jgi:hypothetical protein